MARPVFEPTQSFMDTITSICARMARNVDIIHSTYCIGEEGQPRDPNKVGYDPLMDDHIHETVRACEGLTNLATALRHIINNEVNATLICRARAQRNQDFVRMTPIKGLNLDLKA